VSDRETYWSIAMWWVTFAAFAAVTVWAACVLNKPRTPAAPVWYVEVCSGCKTEWRSQCPQEPIDRCPECPMSEEEFERLKESVRNRSKGGGTHERYE
jgi:hypothetical protein